MEASKQLQDYVEAVRARNKARNDIDTAKANGDADGELAARNNMRDAWSKIPGLYGQLEHEYATNFHQLPVDVNAYHLLKYGESF